MKTYTQLTQEERYQIYALKAADHTLADISRILGRSKSTIGRELKRNEGLRGYRSNQAQKLATSRRQNKVSRLLSSHWARLKELLQKKVEARSCVALTGFRFA